MATLSITASGSTANTTKKRPKKYAKPANAGNINVSSGPVAEKLKVVVRRLPPNIPEDIFWQSVQPWVTTDNISWKSFYTGKLRKKYNKESTPSRAYIAFKSAEQLAAFSQAYDGHTFRDKEGRESHAVVEFAPCQKVPPEKKKPDPRIGTIEQDEDYISFLAALNAPAPKPGDSETIETLVASVQRPPSPKSTPLLDALRAERTAAKDKEAILKAHAHYHRDGVSIAKQAQTSSSRRDEKRKAPAPEDRQAPGGSAAPVKKSRRSRKADAIAAAAAAAATPKDQAAAKPASKAPTSNVSIPQPARPAPSSSQSRPPRAPRDRGPAAGTINDSVEASSNASTKPASAQKPPRERARPTITLQSRQFEAALSGALPSGERTPRPRREREQSEKKPGDANADATDSVVSGAGGSAGRADIVAGGGGGGGSRSRRGGASDRGSRRGGARSPAGRPQHQPLSTDALNARIDDSPPSSAHPAATPKPPSREPLTGGSGSAASGERAGSPHIASSPRGDRRRGRGRGGRGRGGGSAPAAGDGQ